MDKVQRLVRHRLRKVGRVIAVDGTLICSCIILDISRSGALVLYDAKAPPDKFQLFEVATRILRRAEIARRLPGSVGLRFLSKPEVIEPSDQRLRYWK